MFWHRFLLKDCKPASRPQPLTPARPGKYVKKSDGTYVQHLRDGTRQPVFAGDLGQNFPVLTLTTDQGLFPSYLHLAFTVGLRVCWFPGTDHQESRVLDSTMVACGLGHLDAKVLFLARFNYGPVQKSLSAGGRWFGVQKYATEVMLTKLVVS